MHFHHPMACLQVYWCKRYMAPCSAKLCAECCVLCRPKLAARLKDPKSGRVLKVLTTAPAMQFYTGNYVEGVQGKAGAVYNQDSGICLETQVRAALSGEHSYLLFHEVAHASA